MEQRAARVEIVAFDVDQSAIAGFHDDRDTASAGTVADEDFDVEGVAFLDHQIQSVEEGIDRVFADSAGPGLDANIRIDFGNATLREDRFVHAQVKDGGGEAVEVGEVEIVEIGQP